MAVRGSKLCNLHTPGNAKVVGQKGGQRRKVFNPDNLKSFAVPRTAHDVLAIVEQTIVDVREAKLDPRTANAVSTLAMTAQSLIRTTSLEERIAKLEDRRR